MFDTVIQVDRLSKQYRLGSIGARTLRTDVSRRWAKLRGKPDPLSKIGEQTSRKGTDQNGNASDELWALKDVSFEVKQGEVLGIIGLNGAGKSTLLKILSRVTAPTSGEVRLKGRIASLLEVGTGFHPELTGRENIFLNGAVLGMTKTEIKKKFDEMVAFSEVEKFIDTPVKRYSSGMYVRLAFAVAAHLEPEILFVDEVLAVGDAAFQKKCLGKMKDVAGQGRTILFVSHNLDAIVRLCCRVLVLSKGHAEFTGDASTAIEKYLSDGAQLRSAVDLTEYVVDRRGPQQYVKIIALALFDATGEQTVTVFMGQPMVIRLKIQINQRIQAPRIGVMVRNLTGVMIHDFTSAFDAFFVDLNEGIHTIEIVVKQVRLYPGTYTLGPWIQNQVGVASDDYIKAALKFEVLDGNFIGSSDAEFGRIGKEGTETYCPCEWRKL